MRPTLHRPVRSSRCPGRELVLCTLLALLAACDGVAEDATLGAPTVTPATTDEGQWSTLISVDWTLEGGSEGFICALHTVEEDLLVRSFRADSPLGTHHTVLTMTEAVGEDRVFPCDPGAMSDAMLFASGYGTDDLSLPEGVAIRIPAGKQVLLNLHLFNMYPESRSGTSATLIQTLNEEDVVAEAEVVFAGTADFAIPPNEEASATGSCVFEQDATLLSLWPHMHEHGRHMVIEHHGAHGVTTLHDAPYSFYDQTNEPIEPLVVRAGERIDVTCRWHNTSDEVVSYGDTSIEEMCFAGLYRYPAFSRGLYCDLPF
jgi:hypothetical protein